MGRCLVNKYLKSQLSVFLLLCCFCSTSNAETVKDLRYGVMLYHYFQDAYFNALTEVMVAEERKDLEHHLNDAQLIKGGMSLSYGLDESAQLLFNRFLSDNKSDQLTITTREEQKSRAWFYLGKMLYQRGEYDRAQEAFNHINRQPIDPHQQPMNSLVDELVYLQSIIHLKKNDINTAQSQFEQNTSSIYWPFFTFNLASSYVLNNDWSAALLEFQKFDTYSPRSIEDQALKDRAYTAQAYAHLQRNELNQAITSFEKISPNSLLVDKALLGYGWAHLKLKNYRQALAPWQQLRQGSLLNPSVREVYLALPYVYEQLEGKRAALKEYGEAVTAYQKEIASIDQSIGDFEANNISQLFGGDRDSGAKESQDKFYNKDVWLYTDDMLPVNKHANYLSHLISQHDFQGLVKNYRDVSLLANFLQEARKKIAVLEGVDTEQQARWAKLLDEQTFTAYKNKKESLESTLLVLKETLKDSENDFSGRLLATAESKELWNIIDQSEKLLSSLASQAESVEVESALLARFKGLLLWQDSESYPENLWATRKNYNSVKSQFNELNTKLDNVSVAVSEHQQSQFTARITTINQTIIQQSALVDQQLASLDRHIRKVAIDELSTQKEQLTVYLSQAKLSIARLYDESVVEVSQ